MIEEIGKIKLNLEHYPGEDYYCDGDIEDELLNITRNYSQVEYSRIIEEKKSWSVLYHLSELRENIVDWLPITKDMKVLEVGSGCGAITGALSRKAKEVTCIELSKKRSLINAYRHMDCENVTIHVGNFQDIEPDLPCDYDYICLIGVFEYGQAYIASSDNPYEDYLNILGRHKKTDGHIVIAIENKLGLKYWAGCKEDHLGTWFSSLEGYPDGGVVRTFTKDTLVKIAGNCGFREISMYYPYPDYKFMTSLYSDSRLPKAGELSSNLRNFDRERLLLFDEKLVFDTLISEGQFPLFSNSYMMVLGPEIDIKYAKYSNDRANEYKIKTTLNHCKTAGKTVKKIEKHALSSESQEHIEKINKGYEKLSERFAGSKLKINKCTLHSVYAELEYLEGKTLEEYLDECLEKNDLDKFHMLFDEYLERISYNEELPITDYDLIFSNILVSPDGAWNIIDYEWTFDKQVDTKEIAFRAVYCYLLENERRNKLNLDLILQKLGITEENAAFYRQQEMRFQKYVTGKRMSMPEIRDAIGQPIYSISELPMLTPIEKQKGMIQIYEDMGSGFSEEHSFFLEDDRIENEEFKLLVEEGIKTLRIDPCSDYCIVMIKDIKWNEAALTSKSKCITTNGFRIGDGVYAFNTEDPNITLQLSSLEKKRENILKMSMQVTRVPEETIKHMQKRGLF
ncbi:MAG: class I SAM-dependent methyltransferase [Lachnospiraceae bacterium]|nr:class I SAM-dependent methyltransferase [Lachnospiraceae bacterium]